MTCDPYILPSKIKRKAKEVHWLYFIRHWHRYWNCMIDLSQILREEMSRDFSKIATLIWDLMILYNSSREKCSIQVPSKYLDLKRLDKCNTKHKCFYPSIELRFWLTLNQESLTSYVLTMTLILAKSLTTDPYNWWPL